MRLLALAFILGTVGCGSDVVTCVDDSRCVRAGVHGTCVQSTVSASQFCVFADATCPTGERWDKTAGDGLSKQCLGTSIEPPDMAMAVPQQNGAQCTGAGDCASGFCVDGVCCDQDCSGDACRACNLPNNVGTCTLVPAGNMPAPGHPTCGPDDKATCKRDGTCDGAGACRQWQAATVCGQSSCNSTTNMYTGPSTCDGKGTCNPGQQLTCDPYLCKDATTCWPSCTSGMTGQCSGTNTCTNGSCGPKVNGTPCTMNGECASGFCVDGYCCNSSCTGQCQACDLGGSMNGTCSTVVSGQPHGSRSACGGSSIPNNPCAGQCDGAFPGKCDYPTSSCRAQSCYDATDVQLAATCDGAGSCPSVQTMSCGAYICSGAACKTSCVSASDCAGGSTNDYCEGSQCYAKLARGAVCQHNAECQTSCCCSETSPMQCNTASGCISGYCIN